MGEVEGKVEWVEGKLWVRLKGKLSGWRESYMKVDRRRIRTIARSHKQTREEKYRKSEQKLLL